MDLVLLIAATLTICTASFWIFGSAYSLLRRPAVYFPPSLAVKMALGALFGAIVMGFGGVLLATWIMNAEFRKRPDYSAWPCLIAGALISLVCSAITFVAAWSLAWEILG